MRFNPFYVKIILVVLIFNSTHTKADNPNQLFGIELGQDVFKLSSIEKLGSAHMNFKITPTKPMFPFDLYSVQADNNFRVMSVFAMAKVAAETCQNELKKIVHQIEGNLGITFNETLSKKKTVYMSEDDKTLIVISCNRYRKYRETQLKDMTLVLASKERLSKSVEIDKVKSQKMNQIIRKSRIQKRGIKIVSNHDFSGRWSSDCSDNNSGIAIKKLRDNIYHFLMCSSNKCINMPRVSTNNVEVVDIQHLKIAGQSYNFCSKWNN
jgi:hypothetical protein